MANWAPGTLCLRASAANTLGICSLICGDTPEIWPQFTFFLSVDILNLLLARRFPSGSWSPRQLPCSSPARLSQSPGQLSRGRSTQGLSKVYPRSIECLSRIDARSMRAAEHGQSQFVDDGEYSGACTSSARAVRVRPARSAQCRDCVPMPRYGRLACSEFWIGDRPMSPALQTIATYELSAS